MIKEEAQQIVDDLDEARLYVPSELAESIRRASNYIAGEFGVINDDTELEYVEAATGGGQ